MNLRTAIHSWFVRLRERIAPLGYQDDEGFHYGRPPTNWKDIP